ncbi:hypothetical protein BaRGS_00019690, partial [Batillaria attramentaria]
MTVIRRATIMDDVTVEECITDDVSTSFVSPRHTRQSRQRENSDLAMESSLELLPIPSCFPYETDKIKTFCTNAVDSIVFHGASTILRSRFHRVGIPEFQSI